MRKSKSSMSKVTKVSKEVSKDARPRPSAPMEHAYPSDYNPINYLNTDTKSINKVRVATPVDNDLELQEFLVPNPSPQKLLQAPEDIKRMQYWRKRWVDEKKETESNTIGGSCEFETIQQRIEQLIKTPPIDFTIMLYDIRYKRDQMRYRLNKRRNALMQEKIEAAKKNQQESMYTHAIAKPKNLKRKICYVWNHTVRRVWRLFEFDTPSSVSVLHYASCFHLGVMTLAALAQVHYESQELKVFGTGLNAPLSHRIIGGAGLFIVEIACISGILGHFLRKPFLLVLYICLFVIGISMYYGECSVEYWYAKVPETIAQYAQRQLEYYKETGKWGNNFLPSAQASFRCCGNKGPEDYKQLGISKLVPSCCAPTTLCDMESVHNKGCAKIIKNFLENLYSTKYLFLPFMAFGTITTIFTLSNIYLHRESFYPPKKEDDTFPANYTPNLGDHLLASIEKSILASQSQEDQWTSEDVGTIGNFRLRLGECKTIAQFIPELLRIIHDVEIYVEHETQLVGTADPDAFSRTILGIRPKQFVFDSLLPDDFEELLEQAQWNHHVRAELGKRDFIIRLNMQRKNVTESESEHQTKEKYKQYEGMMFPLPRPIQGTRESNWVWVQGGAVAVRNDKFHAQKGIRLDQLDPDYLETDRVLRFAEELKQSKVLQKCSGEKISEQYYVFLEQGLYCSSIELLSKFVSETQEILRELHAHNRLQKIPNTAASTESFSDFDELDMASVEKVIKNICDAEAAKETRINHWIEEQLKKESKMEVSLKSNEKEFQLNF